MTTSGGVKCWGLNTSGQLGNGTTVAVATGTIVDVIGASTGVEQIAAGRSTSCLVTSAGAAMCWGLNIYEIIKRSGTSSNVSTAEVVHSLTSGVYAVSVGDSHICALKTTGDLGCWGANANGQTGDGYNTKVLTPQNVVASAASSSAMTGFQSIGTSMWSTCGIRTGGGIRCWGYNYSGQLGEYSQSGRSVAIDHTEISSGAVAISVAGSSSTQSLCAIMSDSTVKCWGNNAMGLKGFGSSTASDYVAHTMLASTGPDVALTGITSVSVGPFSTCVVASGAAKCSGGNTAGALGNGTTTSSNLPVQVTGLTSGVVAVSTTGTNVSCALLNTHEVKCWGNGQQYQLGNGSVGNALSPVSVSGISDATAIASGDYFSCALVTGGAVKCWGNNQYGQMGNGTTATAQTPVSVSGLTGATAIAASSRTMCALMGDNTVKCWGWNLWGIFGDGTTIDSSTPVAVPNLGGVTAIAMGSTHICALMSDTTMKCWGSEQNGQVGNNTMQNRAFDGQTFVATGLSIPVSLPVVTTTTTTTTLAPSTTTSTTVPTTTVPVAVANKPTNRIDNTVYEIAPALAGAVSAFNIMPKKDARKLRAVTQTPNQCVAGGVRVYTLVPGECRVLIKSIATGKVVRLWQTTVVQSVLTIGSTVRIAGSRYFTRLSDVLTQSDYNAVYQEVKNAYAMLVVGHTAIFSGNSAGNINLSERRAWKMHRYLASRGLKGSIASAGVGAQVPINTVLNEQAQSRNRRIVVYYVPQLSTQ
jgi:alpha-tubulin suppressor-like RCC1 family protein